MSTNIKTYEELLIEWVRYEPETGLLFWRKHKKGTRFSRPIGTKDSNGYIKTQIFGVRDYAHRVGFFLHYKRWPAGEIDHDNRNRADNTIENLVDSSISANQLNRPAPKNNTSGVKGATITPYGNYKVYKCGVYLGTFKTAEEAAKAYAYN